MCACVYRQRQFQQMQAGEWSQRKDLEISSLKVHYEAVTQVRSMLGVIWVGMERLAEGHVMELFVRHHAGCAS